MINRIVELCEQHCFLKRVSQELLRFGPVGALLKENLRAEWLKTTVTNKELTVVLNENNPAETFDYVKILCSGRFPFGIAELYTQDPPMKSLETREVVNFRDYFAGEPTCLLRCSVFLSPDSSTQFFHQWQRQRRMWWRKLSASPGRYALTDIRNGNGDDGMQNVDIIADYPWGKQLVESLALSTAVPKHLTLAQLQVRDGKKMVQAHHVVSEVCLSTMVLNAICDAFDEPLFQGQPRQLFHFHRKLAPYKVSFAVTATLASLLAELNDLALYLTKQLRNNGVSTLLLPSCSKHTLETQWKLYDQLGVPYNVLLNENTLKNGILQLRSRDTTLKEQVHVSDLIQYVDQLYRNY